MQETSQQSAQPIAITFVIPSYNVEEYLGRCLSSLLIEQDHTGVEILVINDGSTDGTLQLAYDYEARFSDVIRVIDQPNKGHGGAVNTGIANARGTYIKVVDADDWLDQEALRAVLNEVRKQCDSPAPIDLIITNYRYDKQGKRIKKTVRYRNVLPVNKSFTWNDVKPMSIMQNLLMHSFTYRTDIVRNKAHLVLPEHTFYVDNLYAYVPLPHVRTMLYLDEDLYQYFIGRNGQSVEEKTMIARIDQLIRVVETMIRNTPQPEDVQPGLYRYLIHYLTINMAIDSVFMVLSGKPEHYAAKQALWNTLRTENKPAYDAVTKTFLGRLLIVPGFIGRALIHIGYGIAHRFIGVN